MLAILLSEEQKLRLPGLVQVEAVVFGVRDLQMERTLEEGNEANGDVGDVNVGLWRVNSPYSVSMRTLAYSAIPLNSYRVITIENDLIFSRLMMDDSRMRLVLLFFSPEKECLCNQTELVRWSWPEGSSLFAIVILVH
jgi:hypothetical protein